MSNIRVPDSTYLTIKKLSVDTDLPMSNIVQLAIAKFNKSKLALQLKGMVNNESNEAN